MKFKTFADVQKFLESYIPKLDDRQNGKSKFDRAIYLMSLLDDPQNKLKVIHIAGTSGKGSSSQMIMQLLNGHGFRTGLTVSPHIRNLRERTQIDGKNISERKYAQYLEEMLPMIIKVSQSEFGAPSFFEITMAHAYFSFWREKVDYAVIETGMGGRYDASNTATNEDKVCLITKIGMDHMEFLGDTIEKITIEKAEIAHKNNIVLSNPQITEAKRAIEKIVLKNGANLNFINATENVIISDNQISFDFSYKDFEIENLILPLHGEYQAENMGGALAVFCEVSKRDGFKLNIEKVRKSVEKIEILGRFQVFSFNQKNIVIDGAHNAQKMEAFISSLKKIFLDRKFDFLLSFKLGKDFDRMLNFIVPCADKIFMTEFKVYNQCTKLKPTPINKIKEKLDTRGFKNYVIHKNAKLTLNEAQKSTNKYLIITGSMYLVTELYDKIRKY